MSYTLVHGDRQPTLEEEVAPFDWSAVNCQVKSYDTTANDISV